MSKVTAVINLIEGDTYKLYIANFRVISDFIIIKGDKVNIPTNSTVQISLVLKEWSNVKIFTENYIYRILTIALQDISSCRYKMDTQLFDYPFDTLIQEVILDSDIIHSILDRAVMNKSTC